MGDILVILDPFVTRRQGVRAKMDKHAKSRLGKPFQAFLLLGFRLRRQRKRRDGGNSKCDNWAEDFLDHFHFLLSAFQATRHYTIIRLKTNSKIITVRKIGVGDRFGNSVFRKDSIFPPGPQFIKSQASAKREGVRSRSTPAPYSPSGRGGYRRQRFRSGGKGSRN